MDICKIGFDITTNGLASCKVSLESQHQPSDRRVKVYTYNQCFDNDKWTTIKSRNASEDDVNVSIYMQLMVNSCYDYHLKSYPYVYQHEVMLETNASYMKVDIIKFTNS